MRRGRKTRYFALLLALLAAFSTTGCAWLGNVLNNATPTEAPVSNEKETASPAAAAESVSDPVFALYDGYFKALRERSNGLTEAVCELEGRETAYLYGELLSFEALLARIYSALSSLSRDSGGIEPEGAESLGEGSINSAGAFTYVFNSGSSMSGVIKNGETLLCTFAEGGISFELSLLKTREGYVGWIERNGMTGVFRLGEGLEFAFGESKLFENDRKFGSEFSAPEGAGYLCFQGGTLLKEAEQ